MIANWVAQDEELKEEQVEWYSRADPMYRPLVSGVHGPFVQSVCDEMSFEDGRLVADLQGFPFVGQMPPCPVGSKGVVPPSFGDLSVRN